LTVTFSAGQKVRASDLNNIADIGARIARATITADSSTWNSATKVVTNLAVTFTAVAGATYSIKCPITFTCASASNNIAMGIGWKLGSSVANTDPIIGEHQTRTHPDATGLNLGYLEGEFTAVSAGQHAVAVVGWMPTGNTGVTKLVAHTTSSTDTTRNFIYVDRVN
jgi:hypothetical protein